MISRIHHVGVVVQDLDAGLAFWRDTLELPLLRSADLADQGVRAALLACGAGEVEVLAPMTSDSGVARFLKSRGEGVHHICLESDDVVREVRRFIGTGVDMIDGKPRSGLAGKVAFVHPRACEKLLVELATPSARAPLPETPLALAAVHGKVEDVGAAAQRLQDLFGMTLGFAPEDGSVVQLGLGGLTVQLSPLGGGFPKPGFTALRLRSGDLPALARRLAERGVPYQESVVGLVVAPGPGQGAPLIVQPGR
jgi:methylmalonyl-CoA epimerase